MSSNKQYLTPGETVLALVENGRRVLTQSRSRTILLSLLAGFYIAFGAQLATVVTQDAAVHVGSGIARLLGGSVFSIGLMLVVICGAELFTGNSLLTVSLLHGEITVMKLMENWIIVVIGNLVGSLFFAWLMAESRLWEMGVVGDHTIKLAAAKSQLTFGVALIRGIFCNWLVCLAVFMATAARDVSGKMLACYVPIMTFVTSGFEHSVANMYFIPTGLFVAAAQGKIEPGLTWQGFLGNIIPVTIGNVIGGVIFVAIAYWYVHLKPEKPLN